jgi:hypothetical protein
VTGGAMNYQEWEKSVPASITGDSLWKMEAYRLSLFAGDLAWEDATKLMRDRRTRGLSDQLYRAVGSVSSNVGEGYSRKHRQGSSAFLQLRSWLCARRARLVLQRQARAERISDKPPSGFDDANHSNVTCNDSRPARPIS